MTVLTEHDVSPRFLETIQDMELPQLCMFITQILTEIQHQPRCSPGYRQRAAELLALGQRIKQISEEP